MRKKSWVWSFLVICLSLFVIAGCSGGSKQTDGEISGGDAKSSGESSDTIKIGVIVADTGPASALGQPEADVARLLNKQLKDKDFNGKKVELIIEDYETDDTNAVVLMKK